MLISPLESNCDNHFAFNGDGTIKPSQADDLKVKTTIEKLGLDLPKLKALRQGAITAFLNPDHGFPER